MGSDKGLAGALVLSLMAILVAVLCSGALLPVNERSAVEGIVPTAVTPAPAVGTWDAKVEKQWHKGRVIRMGEGLLFGPESLVQSLSDEEMFYCGTADGLVLQIRIPCATLDVDGSQLKNGIEGTTESEERNRWGDSIEVTTVAEVGGRPLGVLELNTREILVLEAATGRLLKVDVTDGHSESLVDDSVTLTYPNDMDIDREEGIVYFSDSTAVRPIFDTSSGLWSTMRAAQLDILSGTPSGRLLRHNLSTAVTEVLVTDIAYANGVALAPDKSFVLVCETGRYRVLRHWLSGERMGETEEFFNAPGSPDGISRSHDGTFWLAVILPRSKPIQFIQQYSWLQWLALRVPGHIWPLPPAVGLAIQLDANGDILQVIRDSTGEAVAAISAVNEAQCGENPYLLLGGLERRHVLAYAMGDAKLS